MITLFVVSSGDAMNDASASRALLQRLRNEHGKAAIAKPTFADLVALVCRDYDITVAELNSLQRPAHILNARFLVYWGGVCLLNRTCSEVGRLMNRDHTSVLSGVRRAKHLIAHDPDFARAARTLQCACAPDHQSDPLAELRRRFVQQCAQHAAWLFDHWQDHLKQSAAGTGRAPAAPLKVKDEGDDNSTPKHSADTPSSTITQGKLSNGAQHAHVHLPHGR